MTVSTDVKVVGGLLATALAFGGAGLSFPLLQVLVGLAAIATAAYLVVTPRRWHFDPLIRAALAVLILALILPLLQLVPLPPEVWTMLPGRALPTDIDAILGQSAWRPLSLDVEGTLRSFMTMIPAAILFVGALFLSRSGRVRLLWVILAFALLGSALGIIQATSGGLLTFFPSGHKGFATGLFVNRNHNAAMLLVAMPIVAGLAAMQISRGKPTGIWMTASLSGIILLALGVLGTTSRMGLALLPLTITASLVLLLYRRVGARTVAAAVATLTLIGVMLAVAGRIGRVVERFSGHPELRLTFWTDVRWALDHYGLWGTGFGTFEQVFKSAESLDSVIPQTVNHAHNDFLEIALEGGWPAIGLLIAFVVIVIVGVVRGFSPQARGGRPVSTTIAAVGIGVVLAASLVDYPLRMPALSSVLALLVAMLLRSPQSAHSRSTEVAIADRTGGLWRPARVLALIVLAGLALLMILMGASESRQPGERTGPWAAWSTKAQIELASAALLRGDPNAAAAYGERAIALSPISASAIRSLGLARLAQGRTSEGNRLMQTASVLGWRDPLTQLWAIETAKASNEPEKAVQRAEALFRQGQFIGPTTAQILAVGSDRRTVPFLAKALAANPPWRDSFFAAGEGLAPSAADGWIRLVGALRKTSAPVTRSEGAPSLDALVRAGRVRQAQALWTLLQSDGELIGNGEFEIGRSRRDATRPAMWHVPTSNRQLVRIEDRADAPGKALHIRGTMANRLIEQRLFLPAGRYQLRFWARSNQPLDLRFEWQLICQDERKPQASETALRGRAEWREFGWEFVVPNQDCLIQTLALRRAADTHPEDVWFDSVRLIRQQN